MFWDVFFPRISLPDEICVHGYGCSEYSRPLSPYMILWNDG